MDIVIITLGYLFVLVLLGSLEDSNLSYLDKVGFFIRKNFEGPFSLTQYTLPVVWSTLYNISWCLHILTRQVNWPGEILYEPAKFCYIFS